MIVLSKIALSLFVGGLLLFCTLVVLSMANIIDEERLELPTHLSMALFASGVFLGAIAFFIFIWTL